MVEVKTRWGARAAALYTDAYAARYREHDDAIQGGATLARLGEWLRGICLEFGSPIDVLDLGCGTGRYFHALANVRRLVGIDVSASMLERARHPIGGIVAREAMFVERDFLVHEFRPGEFDLVYSIGVLAEHSPFDAAIAGRVSAWLRPGGRFAFTAVHPDSSSIPRTLKRRLGESVAAAPGLPASVRRALQRRLTANGLYADEARVRDVLVAAGFRVDSIERFESDVHSHLLTVARRP